MENVALNSGIIKDAFSEMGPFIMSNGSNLNLFFTETTHKVNNLSSSDQGNTWSWAQSLDIDSIYGNSIVFFKNKYYLFFVDGQQPEDNKISYLISDDGLSWDGGIFELTDKVNTSATATACVYNDRLYLIYTGLPISNPPNAYIYFISTGDGINWDTDNIQLPKTVQTSQSPTAVAFGTYLYIIYKGVEGDDQIYLTSFNGSDWMSVPSKIGFSSPIAPALYQDGGTLFLLFQESGGNLKVTSGEFDSGDITWANVMQDMEQVTDQQPSITKLDGTIYITWKERQGITLNYASFNWD